MRRGHARRPFLTRGWLARGAALVAVWLGAFAVTWWILPGAKPQCVWASSNGAPAPADFKYAMFPATDDVALFDQPDGKEAGRLTRAMVNIESEVRAGGWVELVDPGSSMWVRFEDLRYRAPVGSTTDYFGAFEKAYQGRDPADFRTAELRHENQEGSATKVTLHLGQDDGWQEYVYQLSGESAVPVAAYIMHGPSAGIIEAGRTMEAVAVGAAAVGAVGGLVVIGEVWRRHARERAVGRG